MNYGGVPMRVFKNDVLKNHILKAGIGDFRERYVFEELHNYVTSNNDRKICTIYGLRRTGKTIMMLQEIKKVGVDKCIYIECEDGDRIYDVREVIDANRDYEYVFIDEITKTDRFINTCSFLANDYAAEGVKVVIAGTDSLGFFLAKNDELLGRTHIIKTTYIPFNEYNYLLGKDIMAYIEYGGTLTDGEVFYNNDNLYEYTNSAIAYNIAHSLEKWNRGENYATRILRDIIDMGELPSFVNKVVEMPNRLFVAQIINQSFKSHDLGSLSDLMFKSKIGDSKYIDTDEMHNKIRAFLGIREKHQNIADEKSVKLIIDYLIKLDVIHLTFNHKKDPKQNEYIFTQPGLRYSQATAIAEALVTSEAFDNYTTVQKYEILKKLKEDICGGILENIVFYETFNCLSPDVAKLSRYEVTKYNDADSREIDVLVVDNELKKSIAIEVKLSKTMCEEQAKNLTNKDLCKEIEDNTGTKICNKVVVYNGVNMRDDNNDVLYINAEDYMKNVQKVTTLLLDGKIENIEELFKSEDVVKKKTHKR